VLHATAANDHRLQAVRIAGAEARDEAVGLPSTTEFGDARSGKIRRSGYAAHVDRAIVCHGHRCSFVVAGTAQERRVHDFSFRIELDQDAIAFRSAEAPLHGIVSDREVGGARGADCVDGTVGPDKDIAHGVPITAPGTGGPEQVAGFPRDLDHHGVHRGSSRRSGLCGSAWEIRRIGMAREVDIACEVYGDAVAVICSGAAKVRKQSDLRRCSGRCREQRDAGGAGDPHSIR
jgi:hypothetical protein